MKIALIGYGKMGHIIESIALERGHEIVCIIDKDNTEDFHSAACASADVAIEFTTPQTAEANVLRAWAVGVPVDIIIGKTSKLYPRISGVRGESLTRVIDLKLFLEEGGWSTGEVEGTLKLSCPEFYPERAPTG